ncbi:ankyrin repeat-containing domain protein [Trichoderma ceciliae]
MSGRSLSMLVIPTQSSSPNHQPTTPNGRPATWSLSAQRKMARLYLYTTLPVDRIRAIINAHSPDRTIKQSSANKRLQLLLDKQPRWLHPHDVEDMGRRITELANSPTQLRAASEMRFPSAHQSQGLSPQFRRSDHLESCVGGESRPCSASPSDECSDSTHSSDAFSGSQVSLHYVLSDIPDESHGESWGNRHDLGGADQSDGPFASFLQQTTFMTESSANTTGTFRKHLKEYTEPYIKVVKRLVKRFTSPALGQPGTSAQHDMCVVSNEDWVGGGDDRCASSNHCILLPGDLLNAAFFDRYRDAPAVTGAWRRWATGEECHDRLYWVTPLGPTHYATSLLYSKLTHHDTVPRDCFQNTVLHFLAVCATPGVLLRALASGTPARIINAQNTAGQTFFHLLNGSKGWNQSEVWELIKVARSWGFDMYARDCYGRSCFHVMNMLGVPLFQSALVGLDPREYLKRDAHGNIPFVVKQNPWQQHPAAGWFGTDSARNASYIPYPAIDPECSNNPAVSQESQLVQNIRVSFTNPYHEDRLGHNGLHCLAMATLSLDGMAEKHKLRELIQAFGPRNDRHSGDSSTKILQLRCSILQGLLDAGLDPNHRDVFGNTPLMAFVAALPEDDEYKIGPAMLESLISRGADVNARNRTGDTALHVAVRFHRKLAIKALIDGRANVHVINAGDESVLDMCDAKLRKYDNPGDYGKYSACRAWLSGQAGAVQKPTLWQQWAMDWPALG